MDEKVLLSDGDVVGLEFAKEIESYGWKFENKKRRW